MQNERNRDEAMDRLLRQRLAGPIDSGIASGACLDGEALAAWSEGSLPASDAARIESHVSQCARCQAVFAVFARTAPPLPEAESRWQRWRLQWLVPIAATATALAIWIAIPSDQRPAVSGETDQLAEAPARSEPAAPDAALSAPPASTQMAARQSGPPPSDAAAPTALAPALGESSDRRAAPALSEALPEPLERRDAAAPAVSSQVAAVEQDARAPAEQSAKMASAPAPVAEAVGNQAAARAAGAVPVEPRVLALQRRPDSAVVVISPSTANRWRFVGDGRIEYSTTGGTTWEAAVIDRPAVLAAGSSPSPLVCWLVGAAGAVRVTVNGTQFQSVPFPEAVDLVSVRALDGNRAAVTTTDGREFRTDDRGRTWARVSP